MTAANPRKLPQGRRDAVEHHLPGIPLVTIRRLYRYIRVLQHFSQEGQESISSELLASTVGVKASQLRKDLAYVGEFGVRGKGYSVSMLLERLSAVLGLHREWPMAIVGVGHIGTALSRYTGMVERGFVLRALFDVDPDLIGTTLEGVRIDPISALEAVCRREGIQLAILTVPAQVAQEMADRLVAAGVRALLNIAPVTLSLPAGISVRHVDITVELRLLSYMLIAEGGVGPAPATAWKDGD